MTLNLSNRAQNFLLGPRHENPSLKLWKVTYSGDKILTLEYPSTGKNDLQKILNESLATMFEQREPGILFSLSFREWESFLRDQNHLQAFSGEASEVTASLQKNFLETKMKILASVLVEILKKMDFQMPLFTQELAQKNRFMLWLSEKSSLFFPKERRWEIALYEEEVLYIHFPDKSWDQDEMNAFLLSFGRILNCHYRSKWLPSPEILE